MDNHSHQLKQDMLYYIVGFCDNSVIDNLSYRYIIDGSIVFLYEEDTLLGKLDAEAGVVYRYFRNPFLFKLPNIIKLETSIALCHINLLSDSELDPSFQRITHV